MGTNKKKTDLSEEKRYSFYIRADIVLTVACSSSREASKRAEEIYMKHLRGGELNLDQLVPGAFSAKVSVDDGAIIDSLDDDDLEEDENDDDDGEFEEEEQDEDQVDDEDEEEEEEELTEHQAPAELKLWVPTYNADTYPELPEFGEPLARMLIREAEGLRIVLGSHDYNDQDAPDIQIERQPRGWVIFLHPLGGGDPSGFVYFRDDGCSFVIPEMASTPPIKMVKDRSEIPGFETS